MTWYLTLVAAAGLAWGEAPSAPASQDADSEVRAVVKALFDGMRLADSAMVRPLFHAKARLITMDLRNPGDSARVVESAEGFIRSIGRARSGVLDEQLSNIRTFVDGSLASVWADYKLMVGDRVSHCGVDHFLLVKEEGSWKIIELADTRRGC
jgi:hypothetical protein